MGSMRAITEYEIDLWISSYKSSLLGGHILSTQFDGHQLVLRVQGREILNFVFVLNSRTPFFYVCKSLKSIGKNLKKPLSLFLETHFKHAEITQIKRQELSGRVLIIEFKHQKTIEWILIPSQVNVTAISGGKKVSLHKPKVLPPLPQSLSKIEPRSNADFEQIAESLVKKEPALKTENREKNLLKKRHGLIKMQEHLSSLLSEPWAELGEWLKAHPDEDHIPDKLLSCWNSSESRSWNIENCFLRSKKNQIKMKGTAQRIFELEHEITELESKELSSPRKTERSSSQSLLREADGQGRTLSIEGLPFYIGRSGADNLKLLRKAKPWYLWFHIKDYPGAHGILSLQRKDNPSLALLERAAKALINQSVRGDKSGVFPVLVAECRYVRPVKGAKAGQVTVSHERVVSVRVDHD